MTTDAVTAPAPAPVPAPEADLQAVHELAGLCAA